MYDSNCFATVLPTLCVIEACLDLLFNPFSLLSLELIHTGWPLLVPHPPGLPRAPQPTLASCLPLVPREDPGPFLTQGLGSLGGQGD